MDYKVTMFTPTECQVKVVETNGLFCEFCGEKENLTEEGGKTICDICKKYRFTSVGKEEINKKR
jgi:hypothetical protein